MGNSKAELKRRWESLARDWDRLIANTANDLRKWKHGKETDREHYRRLIANAK